jgi:DNA-binding phage protein
VIPSVFLGNRDSLRPVRLQKGTLVAIGAAVLAVAAGGGAIAATRLNDPKATQQAIIADAAGQLGVTPAKLSAALKQAVENQIDAMVKAGTITNAQGDALKARVEAGILPLLAGPHREFGFGPGLGHGRGLGLGLFFAGGGPFRTLDTAATYLGTTRLELRRDLANGKTLAQVAKDKGKTVDGLVAALTAAANKRIDQAVATGRLTDAQATQLRAGLEQGITALVNATVPARVQLRGPFGPGFGFRHGGGPFAHELDVVASYLGLTEGQLHQALEGGKSLAQVAKDNGKSADGLVTALTNDAKQRLDTAVKAGRITQADADQALKGLQQRITDLVNGRFPAPDHFRRRGFFRFGAAMLWPPAFRHA